MDNTRTAGWANVIIVTRLGGRGGRGTHVALVQRVVELALPDSVEEALPLMTVVHQNPLRRVAGQPYQHPLIRRAARLAGERDLDSAFPLPRSPPGQGTGVDAESLDGRLPITAPPAVSWTASHAAIHHP